MNRGIHGDPPDYPPERPDVPMPLEGQAVRVALSELRDEVAALLEVNYRQQEQVLAGPLFAHLTLPSIAGRIVAYYDVLARIDRRLKARYSEALDAHR